MSIEEVERDCRERIAELEAQLERAFKAVKLALQHVGLSMPPAPEGVRAIAAMKAFVSDFEAGRAQPFCLEHRLDQPHKGCPACNPAGVR